MTETEKNTVAETIIRGTNGAIFGADVIKRTTGKLRTFNARTGVHKYTTGAGSRYDRKAKQLIGVFVLNEGKNGADAYRNIAIEGIQEIRFGGKKFRRDNNFEPERRWDEQGRSAGA